MLGNRLKITTWFGAGLMVITYSFSAMAEPRLQGGEDGISIPEMDCVIEPSDIVDLGTAVPGVVQRIDVSRGDMVKKGEVVAELESSVEAASLELAEARASLDTAIKLRQQSAAFGYLTQKRNQALLKKSAISRQDIDQLKTETRIARLQVKQEKENKHIAALEYRRAKAVLGRRTIHSPVDGVVMERYKSVGEYVEQKPLLRVARLDPLHVEVIVPVEYLGHIRPGMQAEVTAVVPDAEAYVARVERIDRVADAASGTYGVRLSLPNPDYRIPAGLRCRLGFLPESMRSTSDDLVVGKGKPTPEAVPETPEPREEPAGVDVAGEKKTERPVEPVMVEEETAVQPARPDAVVAEQAKVQSAEPEEPAVVAEKMPELPPAQEAAREPLAMRASLSDTLSNSCYRIGKLSGKSKLDRLFDKLKGHAESIEVHKDGAKTIERYIVLASDVPEKISSRDLVKRLMAAGITDYYVFRKGPRKGRVSLGYYQDRKMVLERQQELADKGIQAEIKPYSKNVTQYRIDLALKPGETLAAQSQAIRKLLPSGVSLQSVRCGDLVAHR